MYGLKPMSFEDELNAPENIRKTRNAKHSAGLACDWIMKYATWLREKAERIPEEDDDKHAELCVKFAELVKEAKFAVMKAYDYNG